MVGGGEGPSHPNGGDAPMNEVSGRREGESERGSEAA